MMHFTVCSSLQSTRQEKKRSERKERKKGTTTTKNRSPAALRIHSANDITRPRTSSRCDTLTFPHRDLWDFKDPEVLASPLNFTVLRKSERCASNYKRSSRNSRHFRRRVFSRNAMHGRAQKGNERREETKRSKARTGPNWLGAAGPPNALRACAGSGTWDSW